MVMVRVAAVFRFAAPAPSVSPRPPPVPARERGSQGLAGRGAGLPQGGPAGPRKVPARRRRGVRDDEGRGRIAHRPSVSVPFSRPPVRPAGGTLFCAYRARAQARVGAGAVRAPDCPREGRGRQRALRRGVMGCHVLSCSALWRPPVSPSRLAAGAASGTTRVGAVSLIGLPSPFRSPGRRFARRAGPCFARIAPARARVSAGAVRAPDCPRARARRRAHFACASNRGRSACAPAREVSGPWSPPSSDPS